MDDTLSEIKNLGIDYQSYLLLKARIKPVIRFGIPESFVHDLSLKTQLNSEFFILIKKFNRMYGTKYEKPTYFVYISRSRELAERAYEAEREGDRFALGKLLGYPKCCIDKFINNLGTERTISSLLNTKTKPSFYCNSLFNFDSKVGVNDTLRIYQENFETVFKKCRYLFLIRHMPCSLDCKESIALGKKTLEILRKEIPDLAEELVNALKRPVLYFDYFNWIVFDGKVNGNELRYKQILPYSSLFPREKLKIIKKGNSLRVFDEKIQVLKDENLLLEINREDKYTGILIDFS